MKHLFTIAFIFISTFIFAQAETDFIHIDQFGYRLNDEKVATISNPQDGYNANESFSPGATYEVQKTDGTTVFTGGITQWNNGETDTLSGDKGWFFDFSSVTAAGDYYIVDPVNNVKSYTFSISDDVYKDVLKQAVRALYYQRCGTPKAAPSAENPWTDVTCHHGTNQDLACRSILDKNNAATAKDLSGGWHDAGDYNKYVNYTLGPVHDLLSAYEENPSIWGDDYNIPESGNGTPDILDEIKWELDWILKMQLADGSVLMKVSVDEYQQASPPSDDDAAHYYGPAQSSATRTACSIFAHAAIVYKAAGMNAFANTLETKAELAWTWLQNNPGYSNYGNIGFKSSNPKFAKYDQEAIDVTSAVYLFVLTNNNTYKSYVDAHYTDIHAIAWGFWYPFETVYQDGLLYYAASANGTTTVKDAIISNFKSSVKTDNVELLTAYQAVSSPYRAYISEDNYVWGSTRVKSNTSLLYYNMITYGVDPGLEATYLKASANYVHDLHGVNPQNLVYLSNMNNYGADKSCTEIYHAWFDNESPLDKNPAPGFVSGGPNKGFNPDANFTISPPEGQPAGKSYKDWNTGYPENSWEITEPADGYQAAYIKMLSKFVTPSSPLPVTVINPLSASLLNNNQVLLQWTTASEINNLGFEMERSDKNLIFKKLDFISAKTNQSPSKRYQIIDGQPLPNNYYRYKQLDIDGHFTYSDIVSIQVSKHSFLLAPNIIQNGILNIDLTLNTPATTQLDIINTQGQVIDSRSIGLLPKGDHSFSISGDWSAGYYFASLRLGGDALVQGFWVE